MRNIFFTIFVLTLIPSLLSGQHDRPDFAVARVGKAPVIDGTPNDDAWQTEPLNTGEDNILKSPPTFVRRPAADLVVTSIVGPTIAGAGESIVVSRTVRNIGNRPATVAVPYRYYLSANPKVNESDVLLRIQDPSGELTERTVLLGLNEKHTVT